MGNISPVAVGDRPQAEKQNQIIDVCNSVSNASAASGLVIKQQGGALNFSKRPVFKGAPLLGKEYSAVNMDREGFGENPIYVTGEMVSVIQITNVPYCASDTAGNLHFKVATYESEKEGAHPITRPLFGVIIQGMQFEKAGTVCLEGFCYVKATKNEDLPDPPDDVPYGLMLLEGERIPELVPYQGTWPVFSVDLEEPIEEGGDKYWALTYLSAPQIPELYLATADEVDRKLTGKRVKRDETEVGEELTWYTYGEAPGS